MLIGGHVTVRGGIFTAVDNGVRIGAEVIQTHPTPAQMWRPLRLEESVLRLYHERYSASGLQGHWLHAVYLINLASSKESLLKSSIASLVHYMELAADLDADGVIFHPGSHLGAGFEAMLPQVGAAVREIVDRSPEHRSLLLVENSAGSGRLRRLQLRGGRAHSGRGWLGSGGGMPRHPACLRQRVRPAQPRAGGPYPR